jgi:two-component system, OmpR family, phosphate regulon sensor histidine kinase PhoR
MKRGIFARFSFLYAVILIVAALFSELSITAALRGNYLDEQRKNLQVQATLISDEVQFDSTASLDGLCAHFKERTGCRVTVIAPDGRVLGDSDGEAFSMENHGGRPELVQAGATGVGMSIRRSDTVRDKLLYVAVRIMRGGRTTGFVRLSRQLRAVDAAVNALRIKVLAVVLAILLATGLFSIVRMERIRRLTRQIATFSGSVAGGAAGGKLYLERAGEFDEIAESLNAMSAELQRGIAADEEERKRLTVILNSVPEALLILDAQGAILLSSSAARKYLGDGLLKGRRIFEVLRLPMFMTLMEEAGRSLTEGVGELKLDYPEELFFSAKVSPLSYHEGELSGFVVILHDITQLKKLEQTRKDFVANISHEIKTPITAINGFSETLLEGALHDSEHAEKFLKIIKANSERINSLVDDLMTISKIELGVVRIDKKPVDLNEATEQALTLLRPKAAEKKLLLKTDFPEERIKISADRDKLIQILTNLVDNAIKFTETGVVTIGFSMENGRPCLSVEDTGIGIPEKHLPRIGERFYRVDAARSRKMGGTGLGLAIVKHLVKAHGWELKLESVQEKGTKVKVYVS